VVGAIIDESRLPPSGLSSNIQRVAKLEKEQLRARTISERILEPFDPFPFNLLTMLVSLEAIFLSIWILISQNQMTRQAERRAHLDLQINLLAEQESTATLRIVHDIAEHLGIGDRASRRDAALVEETDIEHLVSRMDEALPDTPGTSPSKPPRPGGMASP
jgi:uncharacterized membrane protein